MNSDGVVPSLLVFGVLPTFPSSSSSHPKQSERMRALTMARLEIDTITAELRIHQALLRNLPSASKMVLQLDREVLVYREKQNPHWTRLSKITRLLNKQVFIDLQGTEVQHSFSQVKPYIRDLESIYSSIRYSMLHPLAPQNLAHLHPPLITPFSLILFIHLTPASNGQNLQKHLAKKLMDS